MELSMDRRSFLKKLGLGAAAVVAAPIVVSECADPWCGSIAGEGIIPHDELHAAAWDKAVERYTENGLEEYSKYTNFSEFAMAQEIDDTVMQAAEELGKSFGREMSALYDAANYQPVAFGRNW